MIVLYHKCGAHFEMHVDKEHEECRGYILLCIGCGMWVTEEMAKEEVSESRDLSTEVRKILD